MLGDGLAERMGASALLYAAIAYYVFCDTFYLDDMTDNDPDIAEDLVWWLEDIYSSFYDLFSNLRKYYDQPDDSDQPPHSPRPRHRVKYELLKVVYSRQDEDLFVQATRNQSSRHLGNQWRISAECG